MAFETPKPAETKYEHNVRRLNIDELRKDAKSFLDKAFIMPQYRGVVSADLSGIVDNLKILENGKRTSLSEGIVTELKEERFKQPFGEKQEALEKSFISPSLQTAKAESERIKVRKEADPMYLQEGLRSEIHRFLIAARDKDSNKAQIPDMGGLMDISVSSNVGAKMENIGDLMTLVDGKKDDRGNYKEDSTVGIAIKFNRDESIDAGLDIQKVVLNPDGSIKAYRFIDYNGEDESVESAKKRQALIIKTPSEIRKISDPEDKEKAKNYNNGSEQVFLKMYIQKMDNLKNIIAGAKNSSMESVDEAIEMKANQSIDQQKVSQLLNELNSVNGPKFENYSFDEVVEAQKELLGQFGDIKKDPVAYAQQRGMRQAS